VTLILPQRFLFVNRKMKNKEEFLNRRIHETD
jgi:hypothetical protein